MGQARDRGREAFGRRQWGAAYAELSAAAEDATLEPADFEQLAVAAYLTGNDGASRQLWGRAFDEQLKYGDAARAARCAFWLGFMLMLRGEMAPGAGWFMRAQHLLDERGAQCAEHGLLLVPVALQKLGEGDAVASLATFAKVAAIGQQFGDPDVIAFGQLGRGQALIASGDITEGVARLDEAMVGVTAEGPSPIVVGIVYCAVILACADIFDLRRAHEWTQVLTAWCDSQPDLVPYRGQCLVHRAEIMQLHGDWEAAGSQAREACDRLAGSPAAGEAHYRRGELLRLRGAFTDAEAAYREASASGREPQPGLALLRLAQGQVDAATGAIRRVVDGADDTIVKARVLASFVEIMLATGDLDAARSGAAELNEVALQFGTPFLAAVWSHVSGAVRLAEGDYQSACQELRRALAAWRELDAPYEVARVRVLIGCACRELGDADTAEMELDVARSVFARLGAVTDLARAEELSRAGPAHRAGGLSGREAQVLALVAAGKSNREIGVELFISEHTVRRHLQNIFTKLGVSSRAAATAFAFQHDLV